MKTLIHPDMPAFAYTLLNISWSASALHMSISFIVTFLIGVKTYYEIKLTVEKRHGGNWKAYAKSLIKTRKQRKKPDA